MSKRFTPNSNYKQGEFVPQNPQKDEFGPGESKIFFRSSWEKKMMEHFDLSPQIIRWNSEDVKILYINPMDNKKHHYHIDFFVKFQNGDGTTKALLLELKPYKDTLKPQKPKKLTQKAFNRYKYEVEMYVKNMAKWNAALQFAEQHGMEFKIITEKNSNFF